MFEAREKVVLTVDALIIHGWDILFIRRKDDPYAGNLALPGGIVDANEPIEVAVAREVEEETSIMRSRLNYQFRGLYSEPFRDPRGRYISALFVGELKDRDGIVAGDDAADHVWLDPREALARQLAFDHAKMVFDVVSGEIARNSRRQTAFPLNLASLGYGV